eukprot:5998548-Prymnesium_polylepis.1
MRKKLDVNLPTKKSHCGAGTGRARVGGGAPARAGRRPGGKDYEPCGRAVRAVQGGKVGAVQGGRASSARGQSASRGRVPARAALNRWTSAARRAR